MTPQIFPGLGQPKSQLFFDLQAMIAKYGGRFKLAAELESEMVRAPSRTPIYNLIYVKTRRYTDIEDSYIIEMAYKITWRNIAKYLDRSERSLHSRIIRLKAKGVL